MQAISEFFEEHHKRWNKIGNVCGFHPGTPVMKSPSSQSPMGGGKSTVVTQQVINSYLRFNRRSSSTFSSHSGQSEFVYPSAQPYPNPMTRFSHMPRVQSGSLPRPPSNLMQTPETNRHTVPPSIPSLPTFSDPSAELGTTDSLDSASSSSSSVTQLYTAGSKRADEQTESLQSSLNAGEGSEKGSREGSADIVGRPASGKVQPRESQERKFAVLGVPMDSLDGGGGRGEQCEKVKASPKVSPRASPGATPSPRAAAVVRNRPKRTTFSSDV